MNGFRCWLKNWFGAMPSRNDRRTRTTSAIASEKSGSAVVLSVPGCDLIQ